MIDIISIKKVLPKEMQNINLICKYDDKRYIINYLGGGIGQSFILYNTKTRGIIPYNPMFEEDKFKKLMNNKNNILYRKGG